MFTAFHYKFVWCSSWSGRATWCRVFQQHYELKPLLDHIVETSTSYHVLAATILATTVAFTVPLVTSMAVLRGEEDACNSSIHKNDLLNPPLIPGRDVARGWCVCEICEWAGRDTEGSRLPAEAAISCVVPVPLPSFVRRKIFRSGGCHKLCCEARRWGHKDMLK